MNIGSIDRSSGRATPNASLDFATFLVPPATSRQRQRNKFARLIRHHWTSRNAEYRSLLERAQVHSPENLTIDTLGRLPLTDKSFVRESDYVAEPASEVFRIVSTSGTTQAAVRVPHNHDFSKATLGDNFLRLFALNGIDINGPMYGIGHWDGHIETTGSFLTFYFMKQALPNFEMAPTRDPLDLHSERLASMKPTVIASSPAFLGRLARYCLATGSKRSIPTVVFGGAPLLADDQVAIREAFSPKTIRGFYPTTDAGALGAEIGDGIYWTFSETHLIEILGPEGQHVRVGERGRITVTALDSLAVPIIRYMVGDEVTYLGYSPDGARVALSDIRRIGEVIVGDGKIPLADVDHWRDRFLERGFKVTALQLAKRRFGDGREHIALRLELRDGDPTDAVNFGRELVMENEQIRYLVSAGDLPPPEIVVLKPGALLQGRFKVPVYVDETNLAEPSGGGGQRDPSIHSH